MQLKELKYGRINKCPYKKGIDFLNQFYYCQYIK